MRRIRIGIGLVVVALCAVGAVASPSFAITHKKTHTKPAKVLGKFVANYPHGPKITETSKAVDTGIGEVETLQLGDSAIDVETCKKVKSGGGVDSERSDTLFELVTFIGCKVRTQFGEHAHAKGVKIPNFKIAFEFHSNGFVETGGGESTSVHISKTTVFIKGPKGIPCQVELPAQTVPVKATKKPENEFEAATYETEKHPAKIKKFPAGFQEEIDLFTEMEKVVSHIKKSPNCPVEPKYKDNTGVIEIELEEVKIKKGNLGFRDKAEVEAENKLKREKEEKEKAEKAGERNPELEQAEREAAEAAETEKAENEEKAEKEKAERVEQEEKEKQEKLQAEIEKEEEEG